MARTSSKSSRRLPDSVRRRLEVATAMAWESLVETHVAQASQLVSVLAGRMALEESLTRYLLESDLSDSMASAVRTRVLVELEGSELPHPAETQGSGDEDEDGWRRFHPTAVVRGVKLRQRRQDQTDQWLQLALARSEEAIITTHVENAITFAALLEEQFPLDRSVQQYLDAVALTGSRAQAVFQRTMARLADVHLPLPAGERTLTGPGS
jgi:exonuclease VII small subunit